MTNNLQIVAKNYIVTTIQTLLKIQLLLIIHLLLFKKNIFWKGRMELKKIIIH